MPVAPRRSESSAPPMSGTRSGLNPTRASPRQAATRLTASTESWPSPLQYTSCRCRISANSSSTSEVPIPIATAANESQPSAAGSATAVKAPMISKMMPGTEWWTCVPPAVTLRNGPRPSRISRVIVRVDANVTTKETKDSISGSLPAAICRGATTNP